MGHCPCTENRRGVDAWLQNFKNFNTNEKSLGLDVNHSTYRECVWIFHESPHQSSLRYSRSGWLPNSERNQRLFIRLEDSSDPEATSEKCINSMSIFGTSQESRITPKELQNYTYYVIQKCAEGALCYTILRRRPWWYKWPRSALSRPYAYIPR